MKIISLKSAASTVVVSLITLLVACAVHFWILNILELNLSSLLIKTYTVNFTLLIFVVVSVNFISRKFIGHLGFLFIFLLAIKFFILFIVFYSDVKTNGSTNKIELLALIVPYFICLIFSTAFAFNKLNDSN